jgi:type III secretion system YscD/HrpQ family protein
MIPPVLPAAELPPPKKKKQGILVLSLILSGLALMLGMGLLSLFQSKHVEVSRKDHLADVEAVMKPFPATRFTYNATTGKLFLVGHVKTGIEHNELLHQIRALGFVTGIEDNIVNDEAVWQEMNILLSKHPDFQGVSMHSPQPGLFVVNGYLQSEKQAAHLTDYLNLNFNYLDGLDNRVVVEQAVIEEVGSCLASQGLAGVYANISNGELQLTGYVGTNETVALDKAIEGLKKIPGVRHVRNYVVPVTPELGVIDLNRKHMSKAGLPRYRVTGYSKHGNVNINVVINGRIVGRGDCIDGYTVTGIQKHTVFLEREGMKYKLEYNKCKPFIVEE